MDEATALVIRFVIVETVVGIGLVCFIGPRLAARHVERQSGGVFDRVLRPKMQAMLDATRDDIRAEVKQLEAKVHDSDPEALAAKFEERMMFLREDAEQRIANAQQSIAAQQAELQAAAQGLAQREAQLAEAQEMARRGELGNLAKEKKAIDRLELEARILAMPGASQLWAIAPDDWKEKVLVKGPAALQMVQKLVAERGGEDSLVKLRPKNGNAGGSPGGWSGSGW